ncbi:hypothetical protein BC629DRAFT_1591704 [Irpex lacteus]|nr:hypothetical protein BC629DRAFT_1591704 [Irpex lacteus]
MGPFYAYAKHVSEETTWRYLIVFATRSVADEWWRVVSTTTNAQVAGSIQRITPQFYTHDPNKIVVANTILAGQVAAQFSTKMFFVLQTNRDAAVPFEVIPPLPADIADNLSGNWFYIRTPGPNPAYWYYDTTQGVVVASRNHSTRFRITAVDDNIKDGTVLINSDLVELSFWGGKIQVGSNGSLQAVDKAEQFTFGSFSGGTSGFRINGYGNGKVAGLSNSAIIKTDKDDHDAQEWELSREGVVGSD